MKKKWRWPLAGFVLGALVGATVLTVNVVGASGHLHLFFINPASSLSISTT